MGVLFIVFAMSMAFATFYENDFGAEAAKAMVYDTKWFELIMLLMVVNLVGQIFTFKLYKKAKLSILLFHLVFVLILIGAGITRYLGFEGVMHIREGMTQDICTSRDSYLNFSISDTKGIDLFSDSKKLKINSANKMKYKKSAEVQDVEYNIKLKDFLPNASQTIIDVPIGEPMVSLAVSMGRMGQENVLLRKGEIKNIRGILFGFVKQDSVDVNIVFDGDSYKIQSKLGINEMSMAGQQAVSHDRNTLVTLENMKIYQISGLTVVLNKATKKGVLKAVNVDAQKQITGKSALVFELGYGNKTTELYLWRGQGFNNSIIFENGNHLVQVKFSSLEVKLPFSLKLDDFVLDRYPGSSSPSSYKSNVILLDSEDNVNMPYSIYMNHILKYKGWRFYQSSYDRDEKGTILSVNKDFAGMMVTYFGYFMLFLFIVLSMINKKSAFRTVTKNFFKSTAGKAVLVLTFLIASSFAVNAQNLTTQNSKLVVDKKIASDFGKILVQDQKGRTEPLYTLSSDILRKVSRENSIDGYTPMQVFMGIYFDFQNWSNVPLIKVSNSDLKKMIGIRGDYAAFTDLINMQTNAYKLRQSVSLAYEKPAGARNKFDKEVIKVDERLNICYMIYIGEFMKVFPVNDPNYKWFPPNDAFNHASNSEDSLYLKNIFTVYSEAIRTGNYNTAEEARNSIIKYQRKFAQYELPSEGKIKAEVFYYKANIYDRLFPFYTTVGFILLFILLYGIIAQKKEQIIVTRVFTGFLVLGFLFHTLGLAIRWYVSGHAPMSNGFESLVFISWVTIVVGFIFGRRSSFIIAATAVLAGFTLLVAHLSFMDPEITNLVPVLKSYWLTLHVSVIISSYGFFGLGAIIGIIVLILYALTNNKNKASILLTIEELTVINFKALTIGLYLLTIGTFLGAIWANESWGRYWGWDPKETWSLITMIVYSFVIHSRMISGLKGFFSFNLQALFGFSSVLMTYFGVNYYLSGLHSYAGGDPVPVPNFVYVSVLLLVSLSLFAYWKKRAVVNDH